MQVEQGKFYHKLAREAAEQDQDQLSCCGYIRRIGMYAGLIACTTAASTVFGALGLSGIIAAIADIDIGDAVSKGMFIGGCMGLAYSVGVATYSCLQSKHGCFSSSGQRAGMESKNKQYKSMC